MRHSVSAALLVGTLAFVALPVQAAATKPPRPAPAQAAPIWVVDPAASRLTFKATANGVSFDGVFRKWDAQIAFDPAKLAASRAVVSIDVGSVVTGDPQRDGMLPESDWFATRAFPKATFTTTAFRATGPGAWAAEGDLRIRNATRHIVLPFTLTFGKDGSRAEIVHMQGQTTIDRSQFGVGGGQFASPETVANGVVVTIRITAKKGG